LKDPTEGGEYAQADYKQARLIGWFRDVKALPKLLGFGGSGALMLAIGGIGWMGM